MHKPAIKTLEGWLVIGLVAVAIGIAVVFVIHRQSGGDVFGALAAPTALAAYFARLRTKLKTIFAALPQGFLPMSSLNSGIAQTVETAVESPVLNFVQTQIAALAKKAGITDPNAIAYFQAAGQNAVQGLELSLQPLALKLVTWLTTKL